MNAWRECDSPVSDPLVGPSRAAQRASVTDDAMPTAADIARAVRAFAQTWAKIAHRQERAAS